MRLRPIGSPFATAVERSLERRLKEFVTGPSSPAVSLFSPEEKERSSGGDWYGEHAGKWLLTASMAVARTGDTSLADTVRSVVASLSRWQEGDGYLGTYPRAAESRFTSAQSEGKRAWDVWNHAWAMLGLIEAHRALGLDQALETATRVGELFLSTFSARAVWAQGNHQGLSSLGVMEPMARLSLETGDPRFARFAREELRKADHLGLARTGQDPADVGTGKIYQLLWCLLGMLEVAAATGEDDLVAAVRHHYEGVRQHHLTPMGGPWGGIAGHKEVFNQPGYFNPNGLVETCSTTTWLDLALRLYKLTGDQAYLDEADKAIFNSLVGAIDENGHDWCYFTFPNGRRNNTYHWACCKSSGALGLELAARAVFDGRSVNLITGFEADTDDGNGISMDVSGDNVTLASTAAANLRCRIPGWAVGGPRTTEIVLEPGAAASLVVRSEPRVLTHTHKVDHHGQEIVREDYVAFTLGRYVLATGPQGDLRRASQLRLSELYPLSAVHSTGPETLEVRIPGEPAIVLEPYYRAGGRHDQATRNVWFPVAWQ